MSEYDREALIMEGYGPPTGRSATGQKSVSFLFLLQILSETFLILRIAAREIINVNVNGASCKLPVIIVRF